MPDNEINWNDALKPVSLRLNLTDLEMDVTHEVTFLSTRQNDDGSIVSSVDSETLEGDTLWLRSARYGAQNGLGSLLAAAGGEINDGDVFSITKVPSEKSPAGYAFRWTTA
tara:strand:- start:1131 stop:1463 length:333 start_codon:yes stop_codon:yes gene_type:complete